MPRKVPDSDGDSQKENQGVKPPMSKTKVKAERGPTATAGSRAKLNRAATRVDSDDEQDDVDELEGEHVQKGKKRDSTLTSSVGDDEDENAENDDEDDEGGETESPNGRKRARINEEGDAIPVKKEEKVKLPRRVTLPRDRDGFVPGSIVRIQLENFVTYDFVEFRPGANLNMILGPNGTGKSSIACALCIGLNGAPSILGRSTELNAFVKHGRDKGYIEIELKGKIGAPNLVIRRNINSTNRQSNFTLNGTIVPGREINERLAELNVQVGNLCSFLPQDRVSEFAQMTPQQLLKETQRTAGDANLTMWHGILIEKGKELKAAQTVLKDENKRVFELEEKQKTLEKDVKRYRERRAIERKIELFELVLPYVEYRESKAVYDEAKLARDRAAVDYKRLEEENRPLKALQAELKKEYEALGDERDNLKNKLKKHYTKTLASIKSREEKAAAQAEEALEKIKVIKRTEKDLAKNKTKTKEDIVEWQDKVDNPPAHEASDPIIEELKAIKAEILELNVKRSELKNQIEGLVSENAGYDRTIEEGEKELKKLDNGMQQKINMLGRWDADCADVVMWLLRNKDTNDFAKRVEIPAAVSVTVRDKHYVNAVESCFNANQLKTFVTHSEEDYKTFNRLFNDTPEALNRKARVTVWYRPKNEAQLLRPPLSREELHEIGFDGYAIDYIECPEGLKWFLVKELNMHRTPIVLNARKVDENRAQAALSRVGPDGRPPPNTSYIAGDTMGIVSRSAYGQQKSMTATRSIRQARNLVFPTVNPSVRQAIDQRITQARQQNDDVKTRISELHDQDNGVRGQIAAFRPRHEALGKRKDAVAKAIAAIKNNETKLASLKQKLLDYEKQPSTDQDRQKCKATVERTVKERTKALADFVGLIRTTIRDQSSLAVMLLKQIQLAANVEAIDTLCSERTAEAKLVKQTFDEASRRFEQAKDKSRSKLKATRDKLETVDDELQQTFKALELEDQQKDEDDRWTSEKVTVTLDTEHAKLDLNHATNPGVIEAYEARKREIENLQSSVESKEKKCRKVEEKIQKAKDLWYPALTNLVTAIGEKFSAAFDRVRCAGEIRIAENEDYEKWAIEIFVKFREGEPLTLLTGQRQSGGERSFTTILYLMSLTEHARSPFSLVDEINQGMDQRYERMVHDQLVEVTCKAESGQYFLITPKLLPGLQYHQSMKILCVNNGEWLPESKGLGSMRKMIDHVMEKRRPGPSAN